MQTDEPSMQTAHSKSQSLPRVKKYFYQTRKGITTTQSGLKFSKNVRLDGQLQEYFLAPVDRPGLNSSAHHPNHLSRNRVNTDNSGTGEKNVRFFRDMFNSFTERNHSMTDLRVRTLGNEEPKPYEKKGTPLGSRDGSACTLGSPIHMSHHRIQTVRDTHKSVTLRDSFRSPTIRDSYNTAGRRGMGQLTHLHSINETDFQNSTRDPIRLTTDSQGGESFRLEINPIKSPSPMSENIVVKSNPHRETIKKIQPGPVFADINPPPTTDSSRHSIPAIGGFPGSKRNSNHIGLSALAGTNAVKGFGKVRGIFSNIIRHEVPKSIYHPYKTPLGKIFAAVLGPDPTKWPRKKPIKEIESEIDIFNQTKTPRRPNPNPNDTSLFESKLVIEEKIKELLTKCESKVLRRRLNKS